MGKKKLDIVDKEELRGCRVVVWGTTHLAETFFRFEKELELDIIGVCDNNPAKWGMEFHGRIVMSPSELAERLASDDQSLICIAAIAQNGKIKHQISDELGLKNRVLAEGQVAGIFDAYLLGYKNYLFEEFGLLERWNRAIMFSAPKTGNSTLASSMGREKIIALHGFHYFRFTDGEAAAAKERISKVLVGVRDVVGQNLSLLFETANKVAEIMPGKVERGGLDPQEAFSYVMEGDLDNAVAEQKLQSWFDKVLYPELGIDLFQYEFDREKGYSVYQINGMGVFVFQVEKLSSLEKEIGSFLEDGDFKIRNNNFAEEKWYAEVYQSFKRSFTMSARYFEDVYSGKVMRHFYSGEDIEAFKAKWRGHVL